MPVYFTNDTIREEHAMILKSTWLHISQNTAPLFHKSKIILSAEDFPYENAMDWFGKIFYRRLFDIHPVSPIITTPKIHLTAIVLSSAINALVR
jgi:hypothetical protein